MTPSSLRKAIRLAKRFVAVASKVETSSINMIDNKTHEYVVTGKLSGAAKRASMDLTRALAEMRKP
jgi:hypothetical protein